MLEKTKAAVALCASLALSAMLASCSPPSEELQQAGVSAQSTSNDVSAESGESSPSEAQSEAQSEPTSKFSKIARSLIGTSVYVDPNDNNGDNGWLLKESAEYNGNDGVLEESSHRTYEYDDQGRVVSESSISSGAPFSDSTYEYEGEKQIQTLTLYDRTSGEVDTTTQIGTERYEVGGTSYYVEERNGAVSATIVTEKDPAGLSSTSTYYDGEPEDGIVTAVENIAYDGQGRTLSVIHDGYETSEDDFAWDNRRFSWWLDDGSRAVMTLGGDIPTGESASFALPESVQLDLIDENGLTVFSYYDQDPSNETVLDPIEKYIAYDENGNPTVYIEMQSSVITRKQEFAYDDNGNLLYSAISTWSDDGSPNTAYFKTYSYENPSTGETTALTDYADVAFPAIDDSDYALRSETVNTGEASVLPGYYSNSDQGAAGEWSLNLELMATSTPGSTGRLVAFQAAASGAAPSYSSSGQLYIIPLLDGTLVGGSTDGTMVYIAVAGSGAVDAAGRTSGGQEFTASLPVFH